MCVFMYFCPYQNKICSSTVNFREAFILVAWIGFGFSEEFLLNSTKPGSIINNGKETGMTCCVYVGMIKVKGIFGSTAGKVPLSLL